MERQPRTLRFDAFECDFANRQLRRGGVPVDLGSRYFDALALLLERRGELVTKDAFMSAVWHGIPVTDEALTQCIRTLRRALDDDAANPRFIQTVPKHGYRFIASEAPPAEPPAPASAPEPAIGGSLSRIAGAATLAGLSAGAVAGLLYGALAGTGGGAQVLILSAMVGALGLLAGAGLGTGMAAALIWRGRADMWLVIGAALGGLCVGALGNLMGREGVSLLSGLAVGTVTGPFEGLVLGTATGLAGWMVLAGQSRRAAIAAALAAGTGAGALIHVAGGTLLAGSLHALEQGLPGLQLAMEQVGALIGEAGFTGSVRAASAVIEGAAFVLAVTAGLIAVRGRDALREGVAA